MAVDRPDHSFVVYTASMAVSHAISSVRQSAMESRSSTQSTGQFHLLYGCMTLLTISRTSYPAVPSTTGYLLQMSSSEFSSEGYRTASIIY